MLFREVPVLLQEEVRGPVPQDWPDGEVLGVEQDSRRVREGCLFVCIIGSQSDGRTYLCDAAARGARAVVGEARESWPLPYLQVRNARRAAGILASSLYGDPSRSLTVVGVTGTNGKTTTTWLLRSIFDHSGMPAAVIGTLGIGRDGAMRPTTHTTPDAPRFQEALRCLRDEGSRAVAAEISSHALDQERTYRTRFAAVVFTNLTRDHLDYHGSEAAYLDAKRRLFHSECRGDTTPSIAVVNADDPATADLIRGSADRLVPYGASPRCAVRLRSVTLESGGLRLSIQVGSATRSFRTPLIGEFNAWNAVAAYAVGYALSLSLSSVEEALALGVRVPGRMEPVDVGQPFQVIVDYAHTPDALSRALDALRPSTQGRLAVVFGCGGDRDSGKRPQMGEVAGRKADRLYVTSDNPRTEPPQAIIDAILAGIRRAGRVPDGVDPDRESAIRLALTEARPGDLVLIAGKGHEDYQEDALGRRPFDDREVARRVILGLGGIR